MARSVITGAAGFIGTSLARVMIERGWEVVVLDALTPQVHRGRPWPGPPGATLIEADIRDRAAVRRALDGVTHVVHLAAETGVGQSMYEMAHYVDVNCTGTAVSLEALAEREPRTTQLILASSRAVYGEGRYSCTACSIVFPSQRRRSAEARADWDPSCPRCGGSIAPLARCRGSRVAASLGLRDD
jgi:dTDP-L-rhamnose 4-epimerase